MFDDLRYPEPDPNKKPAAEVWNKRYEGDDYLFGKEPIGLLKNQLDHFKKGKVLDVAMGEGRNAVYLAQKGFQVEGIDVSKVAVEKAKALAAGTGVEIEAKSQNLDFFLMPLMKYDSVFMTYFRPVKRFFSELRRGLVMGGTLGIEAHLVEHYKIHGESNPNLDYEDCFKSNELLGMLREFKILYYSELPEGDHHIVRVVALKNKG